MTRAQMWAVLAVVSALLALSADTWVREVHRMLAALSLIVVVYMADKSPRVGVR